MIKRFVVMFIATAIMCRQSQPHPVKKAIVNLPIEMKGNLKRTPGNLIESKREPKQEYLSVLLHRHY